MNQAPQSISRDQFTGEQLRAAYTASMPSHQVDWLGLALDLEAQAKGVGSQTAERAMLAAAHGLRLMGEAVTVSTARGCCPEEAGASAGATPNASVSPAAGNRWQFEQALYAWREARAITGPEFDAVMALYDSAIGGVRASDPSGPVITDLPDTGELETCPSGATNNVNATGVAVVDGQTFSHTDADAAQQEGEKK